jgi:GR25 family glycosyltransferase involved in LPS biosynthesis
MTSAYLLTLEGAKMLLKKAFPVRMPADALTGRTHVTGIKAYGVFPEVAAIAGFESSIWKGDTVPRKRRFYKKLKKLLKVFFIKL